MNLLEQMEAYHPFNKQEKMDQKLIFKCLKQDEDIFIRKNSPAHMTASAWVMNQDRTRALIAYHNIYDSWSRLGGYADGDRDLPRAVVWEAMEEDGFSDIRPMTNSIYSTEVLTVDGHVKWGAYVTSHSHLNVIYPLKADDHGILYTKGDESGGVAWFPVEETVSASSKPWTRERIYSKLSAEMTVYGGFQGTVGIKEAADEGI